MVITTESHHPSPLPDAMGLDQGALLRLLQLASPALPVGAYSYSEGIEFLVDCGTIAHSTDLEHWLVQELTYGAIRLDAAIMTRGYHAFANRDYPRLQAWNRWLSAARETEELRQQGWQMGRSLLHLFLDLPSDPMAAEFETEPLQRLLAEECNFAIAYGLVAAHWQINVRPALLSYLHSWATNLIGAGVKLIPLGQTIGQTLLFNLCPVLEQATTEILALPDDDLNSCGWGVSLASMAHETQYSRLFRS